MDAKMKFFNQTNLTSECWLIQIEGIEACLTCEQYGSLEKPGKECGGKKIRRTLKNSKNFGVPIN